MSLKCQSCGGFLFPILLLGWLQLTMQYCYVMKLLTERVTDTPNYGLEIFMYENNNSMASVTYVRQDVAIPAWHLLLLQHQKVRKNPPRILYNATYKTCEFWKYVRRIRVFKTVAERMLTKGNMSLDCPLRTGVYVLTNIQVPPDDTGLLKFMYQPNTIYTLVGTVYSINPQNSLSRKQLCQYEINATISKTC